MDGLDFSQLETEVSNVKEIAILCSSNTISMIPDVYDRILSINQSFIINILEPTEIACRFKTKQYDFYVILTLECPFHSFDNSVILKRKTPQFTKIPANNYIFDSHYSDKHARKNIPESTYVRRVVNPETDEENVIITDSQRFFDYFFYVSNAKYISKNNVVTEKDKLRFQISRLSLIDRTKGKRTFGIFFSSIEYRILAEKLSRFLESHGKETLMIFVKDISWERLIAIEFIEVLVVIDCPLYTHFDIDIHLPLVTPFELAQGFKEAWNGEYGINEFDVDDVDTQKDIDFELSTSTCVDMVLSRKTYNLGYAINDPTDMNIYKGLKGHPEQYRPVKGNHEPI